MLILLNLLLGFLAGVLVSFIGGTLYVAIRYIPKIVRIFEEKPLLMPVNYPPIEGAEEVEFPSSDGLTLRGSYIRGRGGRKRGVLLFCHEFLGTRWSCRPYFEDLLERGFDIFAFDFRNHGQSDALAGYEPMQWVSRYEVADVRAALDDLDRRGARGPAGVGIMGISMGASAAICAAAEDERIQAVITDGAFPTHSTVMAYILRWMHIYVASPVIWRHLPHWYLGMLGWMARSISGHRRGCTFPSIERAIPRIAPRPILLIHGAKDTYIKPEIARTLFDLAEEPREFWLVPNAKHNQAIQTAPEKYRQRLLNFFSTCLDEPTLSSLSIPDAS